MFPADSVGVMLLSLTISFTQILHDDYFMDINCPSLLNGDNGYNETMSLLNGYNALHILGLPLGFS